MQRSGLQFAGPGLRISDVYDRFETDAFTYPQLIHAVRQEIMRRPTPFALGLTSAKKAYFEAVSGPGKGRNFNFKVKRSAEDRALGQVHVTWE